MDLKLLKPITGLTLLLILISTTGALCRRGTGTTGAGPTTLVMWHLFDDADVFRETIKDFEGENPNIKIQLVKKEPAEYELESLNALAAGKGPDIWLVRNDWMGRHYDKLSPAPKGFFATSKKDKRADVDIYKEAFVPVVAKDNIGAGEIYGLPLYVDTLAVYYNTDLLSQKTREYENQNIRYDSKLFEEPVTTWDDFLKLSQIMTKKDGSNIQLAGTALGTSNNISASQDILAALMLQSGTKMIAESNDAAAFNLPSKSPTGEDVYQGLKALEFYTSFSSPGQANYAWNPNQPEALDAFIQGKVAMLIGYQYYSSAIKLQAPNLRYKVGPLPQIKGAATPVDYASYWTETVTKNSKNPLAAWTFLQALAAGSNYNQATGRPGAKKPSEPVDINHRGEGNPFTFQPQTATSWYKGREPLKVDQIFKEMINAVAAKGKSTKEAIDLAANQVTALLRATNN